MKITSMFMPKSAGSSKCKALCPALFLVMFTFFTVVGMAHAEDLTSCVELTPETATTADVEVKYGVDAFEQNHLPRWDVYKRDDWTTHYNFTNTATIGLDGANYINFSAWWLEESTSYCEYSPADYSSNCSTTPGANDTNHYHFNDTDRDFHLGDSLLALDLAFPCISEQYVPFGAPFPHHFTP